MRIGLIGYGGMGRHHAQQAAANPALELVAVADPAEAARHQAVATHGVMTFATGEELLAGAEVDGVVIVAPTVLHGPLIRAAAQAGKHVFSEKPFVTCPAEADAVLALAKEKKLSKDLETELRQAIGDFQPQFKAR